MTLHYDEVVIEIAIVCLGILLYYIVLNDNLNSLITDVCDDFVEISKENKH